MKKVFMSIAVVALMVAAASCGSNNCKKCQAPAEEPAAESVQEAVEGAAAEVKEAVENAACEKIDEAAAAAKEAIK